MSIHGSDLLGLTCSVISQEGKTGPPLTLSQSPSFIGSQDTVGPRFNPRAGTDIFDHLTPSQGPTNIRC